MHIGGTVFCAKIKAPLICFFLTDGIYSHWASSDIRIATETAIWKVASTVPKGEGRSGIMSNRDRN